MKTLRVVTCWLLAATAAGIGAEDFLDELGEALTFSGFHDNLRVRLSGTFDMEGYQFSRPTPALIDAGGEHLFNPRLTLFFDAQLGAHVYLFAQSRLDRGFDPSDRGAQLRLDEYALRVTPWEDGRFNLQVGKFATVVGRWVERHLSWENPFINAPLPYDNLTAVWDSVAADSVKTLLGWAHVQLPDGSFSGDADADKQLRNPVIWGPSYASGVSVAGRIQKIEYAAELKNTSLASRPMSWDGTDVGFQHPTVSGRLGLRPNPAWNLGLSASTGSYLRPDAEPTLAPGRNLGDYRQIVVGQDVSFAWRHLQLWAEFYEARFEIPGVGHVDTFAYYAEAKYTLAPQLFGAVRWNQQFFSRLGEDDTRWGREIWRADTALGYRFTAHSQLKLQYSLHHERSAAKDYGHTFAAQFTFRF